MLHDDETQRYLFKLFLYTFHIISSNRNLVTGVSHEWKRFAKLFLVTQEVYNLWPLKYYYFFPS